MRVDTGNSPLVIFGFDVGAADLLKRWAEEGYLPTVASVMERGCWGRAAGPELVCEHGTWLSLFSGVPRREHGFYHFRQLKLGSYELQPFSTQDTGVLPFWSCLRGPEKKVFVIDAPETTPVKDLPGIQIANWASHEPVLPASTEPANLLNEVNRIFGVQPVVGEAFNSTFEEDRQLYQQLLQQIERKGELYRQLLSRDPFDLIVVVFSESHTASHQFWKYSPESQMEKADEESELIHAIRDVYQTIDRQMRLMLEQLPDTTNVFIFSLLGMQDQYPTNGLIEDFCQKLGYQAPPVLSPGPLTMARRLMPRSWRVALSFLLPRGTQEQLLTNQLQSGTNWSKTTAFPIPGWDMSFLRVNLKGREPHGIVVPGAEYEAVLKRLEADLHQLIDPRTNASPLKRVVRTVDLYDSAPHRGLPDLFVEWRPSPYFRECILHPRVELTQRKHTDCANSEETPTGFIGAAGPSIHRHGDIDGIPVLDLAPTFLSLLGEPIPQNMKGKVIETIIHR